MPPDSYTSPIPHDPRFSAEPPPPRQGGGGASKVLLGIGIGCGILLLLCCGGFVALYFMGKGFFEGAFLQEPQRVREATQLIIDGQPPPSFEPEGGMDLKVPFSGQRMITVVSYHDKENDARLVFFQFNKELMDERTRDQQMREFKAQMGSEMSEDVVVRQSEEDKITLNGQEVPITIAEGSPRDDKEKELWIVKGSFEGKGGPAGFELRAPKSAYTKEQLKQILEGLD